MRGGALIEPGERAAVDRGLPDELWPLVEETAVASRGTWSEGSWGINTPLHFLPHPDLLVLPHGWTQSAARGQEDIYVCSIKFSFLGHKAGMKDSPICSA